MRGDTARSPGDFVPVDPDQEGAALAGPPFARRSGSEKRKRSACLAVRLTPEERAHIEANAVRAGLATGSYARLVLLGTPPPRQVRRPPIERQKLAQLLGQIGYVGNNINQIARMLNGGREADLHALDEGLSALGAIRNAVLRALGRDP